MTILVARELLDRMSVSDVMKEKMENNKKTALAYIVDNEIEILLVHNKIQATF